MTEYSRLAKGVFSTPVNNGNAVYLNVPLPFVPDFVQIWYGNQYQTPQVSFPSYIMWNKFMPAGTGVAFFLTSTNLSVKTFGSNGISPLINGESLRFGTSQAILSISNANPAIVRSVSAHGLSTGDVVMFENLYVSPTTGMPQICGIPFSITVTSTTQFSIPWDTTGSNYASLSPAAANSTFMKLQSPYLYLPGVLIISSVSLGYNTTVSTTTPHNLYVGQEVAFRIPPAWGPLQLNSSYNKRIPGAPLYGHVISVTNANTVVISTDSSKYTPFTVNVPVSQVPGLSFPQLVPVGDVNMTSVPLSSTNMDTYPSVTQNGPNLEGSFINNTSMGFTVGSAIFNELMGGGLFTYEARLHDHSLGKLLTSF